MAITKEHIRFSIHFAFHLKKNASEATAMICAAYGENAVSHATCKRWYQKFRQGDFSLKDEPRAGRPEKIETDELQALLDINSAQTEKELAEQLGVTQQAISAHLKRTKGQSRSRSESARKRMRVESASQSRTRSVSRPPRNEMGVKDVVMKSKLKNIAQKKQIAKKGLKGEGDRFIGNKMPKHLFSGKRGVGKTTRR